MHTKISLVSGGSGGLGLEIAGLLIRSGRNVIILGRNHKKLDAAAARLSSSGGDGQAEALVCNIADERDIRKTGDFLTGKDYTVEYLFNNAGIGMIASATASTSGMIDEVFGSNLKGMILLTSEILRITPEEEELTIVNIMSTSALTGRSMETVYCASKFGARGYTEALRNELKGTRRNIIAVYPGGMKTDFWKMPGHERDISSFMDPSVVAEKIVSAVLLSDRMLVSDITINRK